MSFFHYILYIKLLLLYSCEFIDISPYEHKSVLFSKNNRYHIFKYSLIPYKNISNYYISIRSIQSNNNQKYQFYAYLYKENITNDSEQFSNYYKYGEANNYYTFEDCISHDYYIVINSNTTSEIKDTFYFFSTDSPYEIKKNIFYQDYIIINNNKK